MPEWGIHHAEKPENDDADWDAVYRDVNGPVITTEAATIRIMGLEKAWNHPAFLDYADRWMKKKRREDQRRLHVTLWDRHVDRLRSKPCVEITGALGHGYRSVPPSDFSSSAEGEGWLPREMLAKVFSAAVWGVDAYAVEVEVNARPGKAVTVVVGLPDVAVKESPRPSHHRGHEQRLQVSLRPRDVQPRARRCQEGGPELRPADGARRRHRFRANDAAQRGRLLESSASLR